METEPIRRPSEALSRRLRQLRARRERTKARVRASTPRRALTSRQRTTILLKTGRRCHICGGLIEGRWEADHVLAHSGGGEHVEDNYLPAHPTCNNYRWDYLPEEFQEILKLGVWLRTQIEQRTEVGRLAEASYTAHDARRRRRAK